MSISDHALSRLTRSVTDTEFDTDFDDAAVPRICPTFLRAHLSKALFMEQLVSMSMQDQVLFRPSHSISTH